MALVFKTPKTALNTTTRDIQNIKDGECPPCPECPEVELTTAEVEYTENGSFTVTPESGFDGLSQVDITVNIDTQSIADEAYAEGEAAGIVTGKAQGVAEQKAKLTSTTLTTNGTVTREDGWNEVTVDVDTTTPYNEGYAAGETAQKAKLTSLNATANGTYHREDGYNAVTVNVPLTDEEFIVSSLGTKTITASEGGFSEVAIVTRAGLTNDIKGIKQRPFYTAAEIAELENEGVNFYDMFNEQDAVWIRLGGNVSTYGSATFDENNNCVITFDANYPNWPNHRFIVSPFDNGQWPADFRWSNIQGLKVHRRTVENGITTYNICEVSEYGFFNATANGSYSLIGNVDYSALFVNVPSDVNNQDKTVSPTTSSQSVTADSGYSGLGTVTVEAVTSSIDANIAAGNIKKDVSILGVTGSYDPQPILQSKTINPATVIQGVQADAGYDGLSNVTVNAVTSAIDSNIQPENILEGITILGVEGTDQGYATGYDEGFQAGQEQCGGYQSPFTLDETITTNGTYTFNPSDYCADTNPDTGECTVMPDCFDQVSITVNVPSSGSNCPDWSSIGWTCDNVTASGLADDVAYAASVASQSTWADDNKLVFVPVQSTEGHNGGLFYNCTSLKYCGGSLELTAEDASFSNLFAGCSNLKSVGDITAPNVSGTTFANNMFGGCSNLESVGMIDGSHIEQASYMFSSCTKLTSINSIVNTENLTDTYGMFSGCSSLTSVPLFDTSKVTRMNSMFANSGITTIPQFDTSSLTVAHQMFTGCYNLTTIPQLDFSKVSGVSGMFYICESLTNLSGFTNIGKAFKGTSTSNHTLDLSPSTVLTKESIMNVINNLAAPDDTDATDATLKLSAESYALLTAEDIAIATAKNWSVVSA